MQRFRQEEADHKRNVEEKRSRFKNDPTYPDEFKDKMLGAFEYDQFGTAKDQPTQPIFSNLNIDLEDVLFVCPLPKSEPKRRTTVAREVAECGRNSSRNGVYDCVEITAEDKRSCAVIRWVERGISTPALEIKCALENRLKRAFATPRSTGCQPPQPDLVETTPEINQFEFKDAIEDLSGESLSDFFPRPSPQAKDSFREGGFEAIAWYQPFHQYDEAAWGIYYNSNKLDAFAASLVEDLKTSETRAYDLAAHLALRLTAAHELFHARVEFAAAWLELSHRKPRYLQYGEHVYKKLRFTADWREEALANWTALDWLHQNISSLQSIGLVKNPNHVFDVIKDWLDFSPPGYRDWRIGDRHVAWQRLANEISTTLPNSSLANPLPLEDLIRAEKICDLRMGDVPQYFYGRGVLADAFFSAPSRREIVRVLKHLGYQCFPDRGKGSHELWKGPDNRAFPVPSSDPLSVTVFHKFLDHFGWTKKQYMQEIRRLL
jgi:predicted RNA binding protein YcfA (HicA-like mRNA interferase family)